MRSRIVVALEMTLEKDEDLSFGSEEMLQPQMYYLMTCDRKPVGTWRPRRSLPGWLRIVYSAADGGYYGPRVDTCLPARYRD